MSKKTNRSKDANRTAAAHNGPSAEAKSVARTAVQTAARGALKTDDIKPGGTYGVRIKGKVTPVLIETAQYQKDQFLGWTAVVVATGEAIIIDPGTRFSRLKEEQGGQPQQAQRDQQQADQAEQPAAVESAAAASAPAVQAQTPAPDAKSAKRGSKGKKSDAAPPAATTPAEGKNAGKNAKAARSPKQPTAKKMSCLDAAAQIIGKDPVGCKDLIAEMGQRGLWKSPGGKTPDASLYAAIVREISAKKDAARFRKVDRGLFVANTKK